LIDVPAGARIASVPKRIGKAALTFVTEFGLSAGVNVVANSSQYSGATKATSSLPCPATWSSTFAPDIRSRGG
jgi:hypothetical protein